MTEQEIRENAPSGATHYSQTIGVILYWNKLFGTWYYHLVDDKWSPVGIHDPVGIKPL